MTEFESDTVEGTDTDHDLDERDVRALTECMTVLADIGAAAGADDMYVVTTESGRSYTVDVRHGMCGCPDAEQRDPEGGCKHVRRVEFATGERPLPAWVSLDAIDEQLGTHVDGPRQAATDGAGEIIVAGDEGLVLDGDDGAEDEDGNEECEACAELSDGVCADCYIKGGQEWS